ncbi:MAG TPA: hypothetical protein VE843_00065, partial [Ktedonobacteraceae bacterium]|nr:hypothetical protein [Ktedonobacteraceae bacterium]
IPRTYDSTLFERAGQQKESAIDIQHRKQKDTVDKDDKPNEKLRSESTDFVNKLMEHGYKVKLSGIATMLNKRHTIIVAGNTVKQRTGETMPVAVRVDNDTSVLLQTGEHAPLSHIQELPDGAVVIVHGKKSRRGVIKAKQVVLSAS